MKVDARKPDCQCKASDEVDEDDAVSQRVGTTMMLLIGEVWIVANRRR